MASRCWLNSYLTPTSPQVRYLCGYTKDEVDAMAQLLLYNAITSEPKPAGEDIDDEKCDYLIRTFLPLMMFTPR